jgi:hypothetical protein
LERLGQFGELREGGLEVLDDLRGADAGGREAVGVLEALVAQPEDVKVGLVAGDQLLVGEAPEPLALLAFGPAAGRVAGDEVVEVGAGERLGLEGEVPVGAQVVDPQLLGPGISCTMSACRAATERTLRPPPPIMIGGRGRCTGVGVPLRLVIR